MIRLRLTRRRHKALLPGVLLFVVVLVASTFMWVDSLSPLSFIKVPDESWLPSFHWSKPAAKPFNPTQPRTSGAPFPVSPPSQAKLEHIQSYYNKPQNAAKLALGHKFFGKILKELADAAPKTGPLSTYKNGKMVLERYVVNAKDEPVYTEDYLSGFLQLSDKELAAMTQSHSQVYKNVPEYAPDGLYSGDGIVYVGGGKFNWLTLLSIRALRAQGCQLPVEVLIPTLDEYELELCSRIFPVMNARCIHLPTALFGAAVPLFTFKGYQYKSLAILLSSFDNVLLMDSDNIPAYAPDHLFVNEPFLSTGLIVWPDFWRRSTSPDYFKIAGVEVSKTELIARYDEHDGEYKDQNPLGDLNFDEVPLHERLGTIPDPSSESGQLMISKRTHMKALLLALYYNLYGPSHYYPLFSQGAQGEGDKETFLAATVVTLKPFYQVSRFLDALGLIRDDRFQGKGMGQFDPVQDLDWVVKKRKLRKTLSGQAYYDAVAKLPQPKMIFVHANFPKLDPWSLKKAEESVDKDGVRYRLYGKGMRQRTGIDFEAAQWTHMHTLLCDLNLKLETFKKVDRKELCNEIRQHQAFLAATEDTLE